LALLFVQGEYYFQKHVTWKEAVYCFSSLLLLIYTLPLKVENTRLHFSIGWIFFIFCV
jgi:hypothetical protein